MNFFFSDSREVVPSSSRTLQRRRQLLTDHQVPRRDHYERPMTSESVHRPSIASDVTDAATLDADLAEIEKIK